MGIIPIIEGIAWTHLPRQTPVKVLRPDIFGFLIRCKRCGGSVLSDLICVNCGAEHDQDGNWLEPVFAQPVRLIGNKGAGFHKRKYAIKYDGKGD